jgi:hypothetical protein
MQKQGLCLLLRECHLPAAKSLQVRPSRVCADRHTVLFRQLNGCPHYEWITGVLPAGDIGRRDETYHGLIFAEFVSAEALSHVAVQVYLHLGLPFG